MPQTTEWTGNERREFCKLCKQSTNDAVRSACSKAKISMWMSGLLVVTCLGLSAIAWSAKSDVSNQKEILTEIRREQKSISKDMNKVAEFIELLKEGKIVVHEHRERNRSN